MNFRGLFSRKSKSRGKKQSCKKTKKVRRGGVGTPPRVSSLKLPSPPGRSSIQSPMSPQPPKSPSLSRSSRSPR